MTLFKIYDLEDSNYEKLLHKKFSIIYSALNINLRNMLRIIITLSEMCYNYKLSLIFLVCSYQVFLFYLLDNILFHIEITIKTTCI